MLTLSGGTGIIILKKGVGGEERIVRRKEVRIFLYDRLEKELGMFERWKKYDKIEVEMVNGVGVFKDEEGKIREVEKQWTVERAKQLKII